MEFVVDRQQLGNGIARVSRVASARMPLPILNNILVTTRGDEIVLSVTDLELGIETRINADIKSEGLFTVPARLIHEFIQTAAEPRLTGKVADNATLSLEGEQSRVKIRGQDASEFPDLPFRDGEALFSLKGSTLKEAIDQVGYAAAIDDTRPALAGIYLAVVKSDLILAATDSYRLAERKIKLPAEQKTAQAVIVPKRTLAEVSRLLADEPGDISVFVGDNQIQFAFGQTRVVSRLIEGNYPQYQSIVPNEYRTRVTANLQELVAALKTSQLFAREVGNVVSLAMVPGKGMTVQSAANQRGEAVNQFTAITEGDELTANFNVRYLLDALSALSADNVFLEFSGPDRPILVRPANTTEYFSLVMPLRLD